MTRAQIDGFFACPCCGLPTLEHALHDTCLVCHWEDEGPDDDGAGAGMAGPNAPYSLAEARRNFRDHGHMHAPTDPGAPRPGPMRDRLAALAAGAPFDTTAFRAWLADWSDRGC